MIPQMTNEQFALWIASTKYSNSSDVIRIADKYYEWLESKKPQQAELKHYLNGVEVPEQY
jgi:Arc/MetJ-type ribon-helix-helix transcriptional regulator